MVYRFIIISNESDDFMREIKIDSDASFLEFHQAILRSCNYKNNSLTSFILCNDRWEREQEITLEPMDTPFDSDSYVMSDTIIGDWIEEEKQHLIYTFDMLNERVFFIELSEIITGRNLNEPIISRRQGEAPPQELIDDVENTSVGLSQQTNLDLNNDMFYGEQIDSEDVEAEGLDVSNDNLFS